jgi:hypothetical protein
MVVQYHKILDNEASIINDQGPHLVPSGASASSATITISLYIETATRAERGWSYTRQQAGQHDGSRG